MKTNSVKLSNEEFTKVENVMRKLAESNNISDVSSVDINLSQNNSMIRFNKTAVPTDLAEEFNPYSKNKETRELVFPAAALNREVLSPFKEFMKQHQETEMIPSNLMGQLETVYDELLSVWGSLQDYARGDADSFESFNEKEDFDPSVGGQTYTSPA